MPSGTVKLFNHAKGFGFIGPEGGGPDLFVHISALHRAGLTGLKEGDKVTFESGRDSTFPQDRGAPCGEGGRRLVANRLCAEFFPERA
jgi:CspA family cold shock protein